MITGSRPHVLALIPARGGSKAIPVYVTPGSGKLAKVTLTAVSESDPKKVAKATLTVTAPKR